MSLSAKEFWKSVNISGSYRQECSVVVFWLTVFTFFCTSLLVYRDSFRDVGSNCVRLQSAVVGFGRKKHNAAHASERWASHDGTIHSHDGTIPYSYPIYSLKAINFLCPTGCATACELIVSHDLCNYLVKHGCQKAGSSPKYVPVSYTHLTLPTTPYV